MTNKDVIDILTRKMVRAQLEKDSYEVNLRSKSASEREIALRNMIRLDNLLNSYYTQIKQIQKRESDDE